MTYIKVDPKNIFLSERVLRKLSNHVKNYVRLEVSCSKLGVSAIETWSYYCILTSCYQIIHDSYMKTLLSS